MILSKNKILRMLRPQSDLPSGSGALQIGQSDVN